MLGVIAGMIGALVLAVVAYSVGWRSGSEAAYSVQTATARAVAETGGQVVTPVSASTMTPDARPTPTSAPTPLPSATVASAATPLANAACVPVASNPVVLAPRSRAVVYQGNLEPSRWVYFTLIPNGNPAGYVTWGADSRGAQVYGYVYQTGPLPVFKPPYRDNYTFFLYNNALFATGRYLLEIQECPAGTGE
jgi:hypothetical protein